MNSNSSNYLNAAEKYFNSNGLGDNFPAEGNDIYSATGFDENFAAEGDNDMGISQINTSVNTYTLVANNTTGSVVSANFFGYNKFNYLGSAAVYGNTGLSMYIAELGTTTIASYAQFLTETSTAPKKVAYWRITANSTSASNITTQIQSTTYQLSKTNSNSVYGQYSVMPFKYVNGMLYNQNIVDIPVAFDITADTYMTVSIQAYTTLTMTFFINQQADLANLLNPGKSIQSATARPVPTLPSQRVVLGR